MSWGSLGDRLGILGASWVSLVVLWSSLGTLWDPQGPWGSEDNFEKQLMTTYSDVFRSYSKFPPCLDMSTKFSKFSIFWILTIDPCESKTP